MVKRRQFLIGSILMSGLSGCIYGPAGSEKRCSETFTIENKTDEEVNVTLKIEAQGVSEITRSITLDAESEKGYCNLIHGEPPVEITIDTNAHSETTKVYNDYQGGYVITVELLADDIQFSAMLL